MVNKLFLFYGNNTAALIEKQEMLKSQGFVFYKGDISSLYSVMYSESLFGEKKSYIIDSGVVDLLDFIQIAQKGYKYACNIAYFYYGDSLKPNLVKVFTDAKSYSLIDDKYIFKVVDNIFMNKITQALSYIDKFSKDEDKIYLTYMLYYTLKNLLFFYYDRSSFNSINPYIQSKTKGLSSKIDGVKLKKIISFIAEVDYKIKISADKDSVLFSTIFYLASIK